MFLKRNPLNILPRCSSFGWYLFRVCATLLLLLLLLRGRIKRGGGEGDIRRLVLFLDPWRGAGRGITRTDFRSCSFSLEDSRETFVDHWHGSDSGSLSPRSQTSTLCNNMGVSICFYFSKNNVKKAYFDLWSVVGVGIKSQNLNLRSDHLVRRLPWNRWISWCCFFFCQADS